MDLRNNRKRKLVRYSRVSFILWFVLSFSLLLISAYFIIDAERESLINKLGSMTSEVLNNYHRKKNVEKTVPIYTNPLVFKKIDYSPSPYNKSGVLNDRNSYGYSSDTFFRYGEPYKHQDGCEFFFGYTENHITILIRSKSHFLKSVAATGVNYGEIFISYNDVNGNSVNGILVISTATEKDKKDGLTEKANLNILKLNKRIDDRVEKKAASFAGIVDKNNYLYINAKINNVSITREIQPDFSKNPEVKIKINRFGRPNYYCSSAKNELRIKKNDIESVGSNGDDISKTLENIFSTNYDTKNINIKINSSDDRKPKKEKNYNIKNILEIMKGEYNISADEFFVDQHNGKEYSIVLSSKSKEVWEKTENKIFILIFFFVLVLLCAYLNKKFGSTVVKRLYSFTDLINENIISISQDVKNDFTIKISTDELNKKDEIGDMARSFNYLLTLIDEKNNRLEIENKNRSNFNEMLGHEITSPLTSLEHMVKGEKEKRLVGRAKRAIKTLQKARDASRYFLSTEIERADLNILLEEYIEASHIDGLTFEKNTEACFCNVDRDMFEQALDNIISNADEHRINKSKISISVKRNGHKTIISVGNFGLNINDDILEKIFIYGFSTKNKNKSSNRGQGLFVVNCIISSLGGLVNINNTETGVDVSIELVSID